MTRSLTLLGLTLVAVPGVLLLPGYAGKSGSPAEHLPPHIRQLTWFGERADFSPDGKRVLFLAKALGDAYEVEIATGRITPVTHHFRHHGFTRALYLANGDVLLSGPTKAFDAADREARTEARHRCWLSVLDRSLTEPPGPLGTMCSEGPAVSRKNLRIAWTHLWRQYPDKLKEGQSQIFVGDIVYEDGRPKLVRQKLVLDSKDLPVEMHSLETQNFVPPGERLLTFSAYRLGGGTDTETFLCDIPTGKCRNVTNSPDRYDEPEGVFPGGEYTTVESAPSRGNAWPLVDIYKLKLDGSGNMERLTYFTKDPGYKAANSVVSDDGRFMAFHLGKSGTEAGAGFGIFLYDFAEAARDAGPKAQPVGRD